MFGIGMQELIIIMVVALLVLGPSRLPQVARTLGKGMREFRKASDDLRSAMWVDLDEERSKPSMPPPAALPAPSPAQSVVEASASAAREDNREAREPSVLPAEIELGDNDKTAPQANATFGMPRAAEGIVARGASLQVSPSTPATSAEMPRGQSSEAVSHLRTEESESA